MSEFIGSRISLISKSDIRYVGTLKAIDSDSATVSLEHVQCMGSEGRKEDPSQEVGANDLIYDGIVFRGSDVKDLSILAAPSQQKQQLSDPAIVQQSTQQSVPAPQHQPQPLPQQSQQKPQHHHQPPPPQQHPDQQYRQYPPPYQQHQQQFGNFPGPPPNQFQQQPRFQNHAPHGFPGSPGAIPAYGPPQNFYGPPPGHGFPGPPPGPFPMGPSGPHGHHQQRPPQESSGLQQAPIGSKNSTPQPPSSQTPQPPQQRPVEMSTTPAVNSSHPPPPPVDSKPSVAEAMAPSAITQAQKPNPSKPSQPRANTRVAVPLPGPAVPKSQAKAAAPNQTSSVPQPPSTQTSAATTDAATAAVAAAMAKLATLNQQGDGIGNLAQKMDQMRVQDGQTRGRGGRGRGDRAPRGGRRDGPQKSVELPKEDFDFESSNAKFNKQELVKEAIASGSPIASPSSGAIADPLASATNGHTTASEDVIIPAKPATEKGYDKKSSFFDNISSDLKDRTEQLQATETIDGRAMRREERTKNVETFGQGSVDGGFRGRGRGRGGRGGFARGGRGYYGGRGSGGFENRGGFRGGRGRGEATPV